MVMVTDAANGAWHPVWKFKPILADQVFAGREALLDTEKLDDELIFLSQASTSAEAARALVEQPRYPAEEAMSSILDFVEVRHFGPRDKIVRVDVISPIGPTGLVGGPRYTRIVAEAEAQVGG